jgi:hypothetical protein
MVHRGRAGRRWQDIRHEQLVPITDDIPWRDILADHKPAECLTIAIIRVIRRAIRDGASQLAGGLPDQLREMARLFTESRRRVVVRFGLVGPRADGGRQVWIPFGQVLSVGTTLYHTMN